MKVKPNKGKVSVLPAVPPTSGKGQFVGSSCVPEDTFHRFLRNKTKTQGLKPQLGAELFLAAANLGAVGSRSLEAL